MMINIYGRIMHKKNLLNNSALFIALLFHVCGLIGMLFTPYKDWFIQNTPLNLLVMAALIIITQTEKNIAFFLFAAICFIVGFAVESTGTHTGILFGNYIYGNVLGVKFFDVPLIIGLNWFVIIYCVGVTTEAYENRMLKRITEKGIEIKTNVQAISFVIDAAVLIVLFDWVMEPVAVKLGFWQWQNDEIPFFNYISWFVISALLLSLFKQMPFKKRNIFAVNLFLIELLFFLILRTFL